MAGSLSGETVSEIQGQFLRTKSWWLVPWKTSKTLDIAEDCYLGVLLKMLCTPKPNGFADHYPYEKWLFHWEY